MALLILSLFFFFNDTATTEIYTLSLHDALPISRTSARPSSQKGSSTCWCTACSWCGTARRWRLIRGGRSGARSEEHTSELQSQSNLVCRLLLEKKNIRHSASDTALTTS